MTGREVLPDKTVTVYDKTGQAVETHNRIATRWAESWRVTEISNMFDILLIHGDKLGNYICDFCLFVLPLESNQLC